MNDLPIALEREPLVEALFEVRLGGNPHMADLLPGVLFGQLHPRPKVTRLPTAEIPQPIRDSDPNLQFAPISRLDWDNFYASFGDRHFAIGCKLPYPKWPAFKEVINDVVQKIAKVGIEGPVERYSLKYVNLIPGDTIPEQIGKINVQVRIGDAEARDEHVSVQLHSKEDETLHILSVFTSAIGNAADGSDVFGVVVDIDSIRTASFGDMAEFAASLPDQIETLRDENKRKFFSCLKKETIDEMGPTYA